jgi:hypothetical protein
MNEVREAALAKRRMVPGNFDDRFRLALCAVHQSILRAGLWQMQIWCQFELTNDGADMRARLPSSPS